ncbi:hypothetical protein IE53DRAFT_7935 [Violaceomyces palustris]|uniref:Uncharacterized protein n=1 Tax=Violaceomyces palustris TaxID=1673888 RepID=A0ACD0P2F5_9BASI|nr:hypothetical protein IE53DRAFT_7935 [Violaceomyces palustris]
MAARLPPEIWSMVAGLLQEEIFESEGTDHRVSIAQLRGALFNLCLVNKVISSLTLSFLYHKIRLFHPRDFELLVENSIEKNGHLVRLLDLEGIDERDDLLEDAYITNSSLDPSSSLQWVKRLPDLPQLCPNLEILRWSASLYDLYVHQGDRGESRELYRSFLRIDSSWSRTLTSLSLPNSKSWDLASSKASYGTFMDPLASLGSIGASHQTEKRSSPRSLRKLALPNSRVDADFVVRILTDKTFSNLKELDLSYCRDLTDDVVEPLSKSLALGLGRPVQSLVHYKDDTLEVHARLSKVDLTGTYLMDIEDIGADIWEDVSDEDDEEDR